MKAYIISMNDMPRLVFLPPPGKVDWDDAIEDALQQKMLSLRKAHYDKNKTMYGDFNGIIQRLGLSAANACAWVAYNSEVHWNITPVEAFQHA